MREGIAVVAITKHGVHLARRLQERMEGVTLYYMDKFACGDEEERAITLFQGSVKKILPALFSQYSGIVLFISLGAVVRMIAPILKDKQTDPAVVVVDDLGKFAISVLSGHLGGANELTKRVATCLRATPVITTASDVKQTIAVDLFGRAFGWEIEDFTHATPVSAAVVNEERVVVIQESGEPHWWAYDRSLPSHIRVADSFDEVKPASFDAVLVVTHRLLTDQEAEAYLSNGMLYRPKVLVLGIGCNKGTSAEEIEHVIVQTLNEQRYSIKSVRNLATIDLKKEEPGLLAVCRKYGWPLVTYTPAELNMVSLSNPSPTVYRYTGAYGVSEPAALLSACAADWLLPKKKAGNVTLSIALVPFPSVKEVIK